MGSARPSENRAARPREHRDQCRHGAERAHLRLRPPDRRLQASRPVVSRSGAAQGDRPERWAVPSRHGRQVPPRRSGGAGNHPEDFPRDRGLEERCEDRVCRGLRLGAGPPDDRRRGRLAEHAATTHKKQHTAKQKTAKYTQIVQFQKKKQKKHTVFLPAQQIQDYCYCFCFHLCFVVVLDKH